MSLPCEHENEVTYVNRVLAFIFATDDSFAARQMNGLSGKESLKPLVNEGDRR